MAYNVREMLNNFTQGLMNFSRTNPEYARAFVRYQDACAEPKTLDLKTKELMSIVLSCYIRCDYCIVYHSYNAFKEGASKEEIREAAMLAVAYGGGPTMAYTVTLLEECIAEFEGDFK